VESEDVIEVSLVDIDVLALRLGLLLLQEFDVDLHALADAVVCDGPSGYDAVAELALLDADDKVARALTHPLLQVLQQLSGVLAEVDVDALGLRLQDAVFVDQNEPHNYLIRNTKSTRRKAKLTLQALKEDMGINILE
jgi:hypothetical protein